MKSPSDALFVGRKNELVLIDKQWKLALSEKDIKFILIQGDFGSGKTALATTFLQNATSPKTIIGTAQCALESENNSLVPFVQLFESITKQTQKLKTTASSVIEIVSDIAPAWIDVFTAGAATNIAEATSKTLKLGKNLFSTSNVTPDNIFVQFTNLISRLTKNHPSILFIDDIHWADASSLSLIFHLSRYLKDRSILFILTYRPVEGLQTGSNVKSLREIRANLIRYGALEIDIKDGLDIEQYIIRRYPNNTFPHDVIHRIQDQGDGYALYVAQLFTWWEETGAIYKKEDTWNLRDDAKFMVPPSIGEILDERIQLMEESLRETLRVASVQGDDFTAQIISSTNNINEYDVYNLLDLLEKRYKLVKDDHKEELGVKVLDFYRFLHRFFREQIYKNLNTGQKRLLHLRVADCLEMLYEKDTAPISSQLARHYFEANKFEKAVMYSLTASQQEYWRYGWLESQKWCEFGLSILKTHPYLIDSDIYHFNLLEQLGAVYCRFGNWSSARSCFTNASEIAAKTTIGPDHLIEIYALLVEIAENENDLSAANSYLDVCKSLLAKQTNPSMDLFLKVQLVDAIIKIWMGENQKAVEILTHALNMPREKETPDLIYKIATAYNYLATAFSNLDRYQDATNAFNKMITLAQEIGDKGLEALGLTTLVEDATYQGKYMENLPLINRAIDLSISVGDRETESYALATRGHLYLKSDKFTDAIKSLNESLEICKEIETEWNLALIYADLALAHLGLSDKQQAKEYSSKAIKHGRKGYKYLLGISLDVGGQVNAFLEKWKDANHNFEESIMVLEESGDFHLAAISRVHYAETLINQNKKRQAVKLLEEALIALREIGVQKDIEMVNKLMRSVRKNGT